jgi:drug/metabolite transporter (DMT)-like permease
MTPDELAIVLLSAVLHAVWSVSIKASGDPQAFNVLQVVPQALIALAVLPALDLAALPAAVWWLLLGTSAAHGLYLYWMCRAYEEADLTLVYPIVRSTPAFLPLVAVPLLDESLSAVGGLGIAVVVSGIWLVHSGAGGRQAGRGPGSLLGRGSLFAYLTLATTVAYSLFDKGAMAQLHDLAWSARVPRALAYYLLLELGCAFLFVPLAWRRLAAGALARTARLEWRSVVAACAFTIAGYALILQAMRTAPASYVVAVRQTSVLFAVVLGAVWLRERPTRPRVLGSAATVAGVALVALGG